jgi:hypothetical protein
VFAGVLHHLQLEQCPLDGAVPEVERGLPAVWHPVAVRIAANNSGAAQSIEILNMDSPFESSSETVNAQPATPAERGERFHAWGNGGR